MARLAGWLSAFLILFSAAGFVFCDVLLWVRREPWYVAGTTKGLLPTHCGPHSPMVYIQDRQNGVLHFPDHDLVLAIPEPLRGSMYIDRYPSPGRYFTFRDGSIGNRRRYWDATSNREVPIPESCDRSWKETPDGSHLLLMETGWNRQRRFRVQRLDGSIVRELVLPSVPPPPGWDIQRPPAEAFTFSPEGRFLTEREMPETETSKVRVYNVETGFVWTLGSEVVDVSDDGGVLIKMSTLTSDGGRGAVLTSVDFSSRRERWREEFQAGIRDVARIGSRLLVQDFDCRVHVLDAITGRRLFELENASGAGDLLRTYKLLDGAPTPMIAADMVWDFETGRKLPFRKPSMYPLDFFPDGRRVLISNLNGPAEIVDIRSGKRVFCFNDVRPRAHPAGYARMFGEQVLIRSEKTTDQLEVWERRHPEGWRGHLFRPELYGAIFCGAAMLVFWVNRPRPTPM